MKRRWFRKKVASLRSTLTLSPTQSSPTSPRPSFSRDHLRRLLPSRSSHTWKNSASSPLLIADSDTDDVDGDSASADNEVSGLLRPSSAQFDDDHDDRDGNEISPPLSPPPTYPLPVRTPPPSPNTSVTVALPPSAVATVGADPTSSAAQITTSASAPSGLVNPSAVRREEKPKDPNGNGNGNKSNQRGDQSVASGRSNGSNGSKLSDPSRRDRVPLPQMDPDVLKRLNSRGPPAETQASIAAKAAASAPIIELPSLSRGGSSAGGGQRKSKRSGNGSERSRSNSSGSGDGKGGESGMNTPTSVESLPPDPLTAQLQELWAYQGAEIGMLSPSLPIRGGSPPQSPSGPGMHRARPTFRVQHYLVDVAVEKQQPGDRFGTKIVLIPPPAYINVPPLLNSGMQTTFLPTCSEAFAVDVGTGSPTTHHIRLGGADDTLLHMTVSATPRVWDVRDGQLFDGPPDSAVVGRIHKFASKELLFTFVPDRGWLPDWPRLEMREIFSEEECRTFKLAVASEFEREVGYVYALRHYYDVRIVESSRAEALLWFSIVLAAMQDSKRSNGRRSME